MFGLLERHYKILITSLALLLAVGYVHKLCWPHLVGNGFEYGFSTYEKWKQGQMRWTWRKARMRVEARSNLFGVSVTAAPYNSEVPDGLTLKVYLDDKILDSIHFFNGGNRHLYYFVPEIEGKEIEIGMEVDRTFNLFRLGISEDARDLGVVVSPVTFLEIIPKDGVGFYHWETLDTQSAESMAQSGERGAEDGKEKRFRWTGKRASEVIGEFRKKGEGLVVFLRCGHPGIDKEPVVVRILGDGELLRYVEFSDYGWKRVDFGADELEGKGIVTYEVSRTWNPKRMGVSGDGRDLGVAVAVP